MSYVWYYSAITALFLSVSTFFYLRQRRIPNLCNRLFTVMLVLGTLAAAFDALGALAQSEWTFLPRYAHYGLDMAFVICLQLCLPLYATDILAMTGRYRKISKRWRLLLYAPCAVTLALAVLSPLGRFGIFYIDQQNQYQNGATHFMLYANSVFYLSFGGVTVFRDRRMLNRRKTLAVGWFTGILAAAMALQIAYPRYLLTTTATGLGLTAMYHLLLTPSEFIDPVTEAFNRASLPRLLDIYTERNLPYLLTVFNLREGAAMGRSLGTRMSELLLNLFAETLQVRYYRKAILRVDNYALAVLAPLDSDPADAFREIPKIWNLYTFRARANAWAFVIDSRTTEDVMGLMDYMLQQPPPPPETRVIYADQKVLEAFHREQEARSALRREMNEAGLHVRYEPMVDRKGGLWALEAYPYFDDPSLANVTPEALERLAASEGGAAALWAEGFGQACRMAAGPWTPKMVYRLSAAACMRQETLKDIRQALSAWGAKAERIVFGVMEDELARYETEMRPTLDRLIRDGFSFMMDAVGAGSVNFSAVSWIPFQCVRLCDELMADRETDPRQRLLLDGIGALARDARLLSACAGADTPERLRGLRELGIAVVQGKAVASPMNESQAEEYLKRLSSQGGFQGRT